MASGPSDWKDVAIKWSQEHLEPRCETILSEVFVATNFQSLEVFMDPSVRDRGYPELPGYLPGTTDLVCILKDGKLLVADWKTGGGTGSWEQLLSLAFGLSRSPWLRHPDGSIRDVCVAVLYYDKDNDEVHVNEWDVTNEELEAHARAMAFQMADIGVRTEHVQGSHCTQLYCPHLAYCDAVQSDVTFASTEEGLARELPVVYDRVQLTDKPNNDHEAGLIMARIAAARRQMKYYESGIKEYLANGGRAIDGQFEWKEVQWGSSTCFRWVKKADK